MNFFDFNILYFRAYENMLLGAFHGILFSFPFSAPMLLCVRHFVHDGFKKGSVAVLGSVLGQITFFVILCVGLRPLAQLWYATEPLLALVGVSLVVRRATEFYAIGSPPVALNPSAGIDKNFSRTMLGFAKGNEVGLKNIFCFQFFVMFLNPQVSATLSRILLNHDLLDIFTLGLPYVSDSLPAFNQQALLLITKTSPVSFVTVGYVLAFCFSSFALLATVGTLILFLSETTENLSTRLLSPSRSLRTAVTGTIERSSTLPLSLLSFTQGLLGKQQQGSPTAPKETKVKFFSGESNKAMFTGILTKLKFFLSLQTLNKIFVFCILGCALQGSVHYTWRLFIQYPLEFIPYAIEPVDVGNVSNRSISADSLLSSQGISSVELPSNTADAKQIVDSGSETARANGLREFPSFDSNLRHREKNLPVERHLPIERMNARRSLSGRAPFNEEQKSNAYVKYSSFFLNSIEKSIENTKINFQDPLAASYGVTNSSPYPSLSNVIEHVGIAAVAVGETPTTTTATTTFPNSLKGHNQSIDNGLRILQKMKERLVSSPVFSNFLETIGAVERSSTTTLLTKESSASTDDTTKGKPKSSYIRNLFDKESSTKNFLHDDLSIYAAVLNNLIVIDPVSVVE